MRQLWRTYFHGRTAEVSETFGFHTDQNGKPPMTEIEPGQTWEVYSEPEGRWVKMIVAKVEGETVTLRYAGVIEFLTVDLADLQAKPDVFRRAEAET